MYREHMPRNLGRAWINWDILVGRSGKLKHTLRGIPGVGLGQVLGFHGSGFAWERLQGKASVTA